MIIIVPYQLPRGNAIQLSVIEDTIDFGLFNFRHRGICHLDEFLTHVCVPTKF